MILLNSFRLPYHRHAPFRGPGPEPGPGDTPRLPPQADEDVPRRAGCHVVQSLTSLRETFASFTLDVPTYGTQTGESTGRLPKGGGEGDDGFVEASRIESRFWYHDRDSTPWTRGMDFEILRTTRCVENLVRERRRIRRGLSHGAPFLASCPRQRSLKI